MVFLQNSTNSSGVTLALRWLPVLIMLSKKVHYLSAQKRGIISLIPKKNKDKTLLENLRAISLQNVDYKIMTKSIAKRLEKALPKMINYDQTSYNKERFIGEIVRLIQDVMFTLNRSKNPLLRYYLTFEKCLIQ